MDLILHNPIADMVGPDFLLFYLLLIGVVALWCRWRVVALQEGSKGGLPPVPGEPVPYEIAYLRGGENEVIRLGIFHLLQRGYLMPDATPATTTGQQRLRQAMPAQNPASLDPIEREIVAAFAAPTSLDRLYTEQLRSQVARFCGLYRQRLLDQGLLVQPGAKEEAMHIGVGGAALLLSLSAYRLWLADLKGHHNIGFLLILTLIAPFVVAAVCSVPRMTRRGQAYVRQMQAAFGQLHTRVRGPEAELSREALLLVGVFGVTALASTSYAFLPQMCHPQAISGACCGIPVSSSSCSAGSSCGGGGGCGGGGCGGGGCGG